MSDLTDTGPAASRNVTKTLAAAVWMYGGRGIGMLWTFALIGRLGISDYGLYGMAFALAMVVGPPLDNPFAVRAMRESEERFVAERTTRYLLGLILMVLGALMISVNFVVWFGLFVAGGEMVFRTYQSQFARDGHPDRVWRLDTIRTVISVGMASAYLFAVEHPTLLGAGLLYCAPYLVVAALCGFSVWGHRPGIPGSPRLMAMLVAEMGGTCLYLQGDVLLLGWITDSRIAGYYSLTVVLTVALAAFGQSFGMTYHQPLRDSGGDLAAGPKLRSTLLIGAGAGVLVAVVGVGLLISPAPTQLAVAMLLMSLFCAMRTITSVFQVVLYAQRRDLVRLGSNLGLVPVKLGLVVLLASAGAVGAAIASVITDAILLTIYATALYGRRRRKV